MSNLNKDTFKGIYTALVTPFTEDSSSIDLKSLEKLIEYQISAGISGIVACGSTGESATLTEDEFREVVKKTQSVTKGLIPCVVGIGTNDTRRACELTEYLSTQKVDGLLIVTPPYVKPTQAGIIEHFRKIKAAAKGVPLIAYNIPGRAVANILPETVARLADEDLIIGIKDSTGSLDQALDSEFLLKGRISVVAGDDSLILPLMACGGRGAISASANAIPEILVALCKFFESGDVYKARECQLKALPIIRALFMETNPIPVKAALKERGIISCGSVRLPLTNAQNSTIERLKSLFGL